MSKEEKPARVFDLEVSEKKLHGTRQNLELVGAWAAREMLKRVGGDDAADVFQPLVGGYKNARGQDVGALSENGMARTEIVQRHALSIVAQARADYEGAHADYREALRQSEKKEADDFAASMKKLSEEQVVAANALNTHTDGLKKYTAALVFVGVTQIIVAIIVAVVAAKGH